MTAGFVNSYLLWYFFLITIYYPLISYCFMKCEIYQTNDVKKREFSRYNIIWRSAYIQCTQVWRHRRNEPYSLNSPNPFPNIFNYIQGPLSTWMTVQLGNVCFHALYNIEDECALEYSTQQIPGYPWSYFRTYRYTRDYRARGLTVIPWEILI